MHETRWADEVHLPAHVDMKHVDLAASALSCDVILQVVWMGSDLNTGPFAP